MGPYTHRNTLGQCSIQVMVLLPGNQFLLTRAGPMALWELSLNIWVPNFNTLPTVTVRKELQQVLSLPPAGHNYKLEPLLSVSSTLSVYGEEIKVFLITITEMLSFSSTARKEFQTRTLDQVVNSILHEGAGRGLSDIYCNTTMTVLRNIGDSDLIWNKKLTNSWAKKSSLQV